MIEFKNKNSIFVVFTGFLIALSRFLLGSIDTKTGDDKHILVIMALVNYVALGVVLLFLYNDFYRICKSKIASSGVDTLLKKKCNFIMLILSMVLSLIYLIFGILYITKFKTADLNDVMSIIALALSIATNGLIEDYRDSYYKLVLKIAKFKLKIKRH